MHIGIDGSRCDGEEPTGVERYASLVIPPLVAELHRRGHRVTLYVHHQPVHPYPDVRTRVIRVPRLWTHVGLGPAAIMDRVDRLFVPAHVLPLLRPRFSAVVLHDACFEEVPEVYAWLDRWYLRLTTADALRTARVLTHSPASARAFYTIYRPRRDTVTVVPPAAPPVRGAVLPVPWPQPYLLCIGRIERKKNLATLLRAFDRLIAQRPGLPHHLVLLGDDGLGSASIHRLHESLSTRARVHFHGYADETLRDVALRTASGLVLPSLCEGSSLVLLEARVSRLPFASSGCLPCREAGGTDGIYVEEPRNLDAWVIALTALIDRPRAPAPPPERSWADVARAVADVLTAPDASYQNSKLKRQNVGIAFGDDDDSRHARSAHGNFDL